MCVWFKIYNSLDLLISTEKGHVCCKFAAQECSTRVGLVAACGMPLVKISKAPGDIAVARIPRPVQLSQIVASPGTR